MPSYSYRCLTCNTTFELVVSMKDVKQEEPCPTCGKSAYHDLVADHSGGCVDSQNREYEFYGSTGTRMYSAAYLPNQIDEARKKHPGTDFVLHNGCYIPRIRNRRHKLQFLRERGFIEYD